MMMVSVYVYMNIHIDYICLRVAGESIQSEGPTINCEVNNFIISE